jgi:hypothetical protein
VHRARLSRVVAAALLSEVAEIVALPDLRSEVPEDRVRNRDVKKKSGSTRCRMQSSPPNHPRTMGGVSSYVCDCAPAISSGCTFCRKPRVSRSPPLQCRIHHRDVPGCWRVALHQLRHVRVDMRGKLHLEDWISAKLKLPEINDGFANMKAGKTRRSVIVFDS